MVQIFSVLSKWNIPHHCCSSMEHFIPHDRAEAAVKLPAGFSNLSQVSALINQIYAL